MGQSGPGHLPEIGRPRGAVWRTLANEGIVWEDQVTIAGERTDLHARMIVTGQRIVFVRDGAIALDAQRDWLDPTPALGRNGRVTLSITTPNGNGPIPVEIRVRDGRFGAARLLARLGDRPASGASPFSSPTPRSPRRDRPVDSGQPDPAPRSRSADEPRPARPEAHPFRPERRPTPPPIPTPEPAPSATSSFGFGIPAASLPPSAIPMPSFGVAAPAQPDQPTEAHPPGSPADAARPTQRPEPVLSLDAVNRAFGDQTSPSARAGQPAGAPSPTVPESPTRWTLASELLARSTPAPAARDEPAAPASPIGTTGHVPPTIPAGASDGARAGTAGPLSLAADSGQPADLDGIPATPPGMANRPDPVGRARPAESPGSRTMLPGLPAPAPPSDAASDRRRVSAAPSGRVAGNSVITARSSAAARQAAKQSGALAMLPPGEVLPSAVALASTRAGVPLAPTPGPVPVGDVPVLAEGAGANRRRGMFAGGGRLAWGVTAVALVALTLAAGLYLALGIPDDGGNGRNGRLGQPTAAGSDQSIAIVATPPPATATTTPVRGETAPARPAPTATRSIPRGVGGETSIDGLPTQPATDPSGSETDAQAATSDPGAGEPPAAAVALEPTATVTLAPTFTPTSTPTAALTATTAPTAVPTATTAPTVPPTATTAPTVPPTATTAPTATVPPTATATNTPEPTATVAPTATATPTREPTAPPTATAVPPTATAVPPTATTVPPTATVPPPTATVPPPTATAIPPTATTALPTATAIPPTATTVPPTATAVPPTATVAPTVTLEPTVAPTATLARTEAPTATATTAPTATTTTEPTATIEPTATTDLAAIPETAATPDATVEPTATAAAPTATAGPDVSPQPSTVADDGVPAQVFTAGSVRYTVESVEAGPTIPEIDQPESPFGGDWLAVVLSADNWGDADATIDMTQFTAYIGSNDETRRLDSYSQMVAIRLGFPQVVGPADQVTLAPGDSVRLGLLFPTERDAAGFVLNAGTEAIDLTQAIDASEPMDELGDAPAAPDLLEATVTKVIDGTTIEVEIDGQTIPVRYTGTTAPDAGSCFADAATEANRDLVMGQTVWLERQNTNVDTDGAWLRDVWVEGDSGALELVASILVQSGAIDVSVERPDSRYAAFLETLAATAKTDGVGLWGECPG